MTLSEYHPQRRGLSGEVHSRPFVRWSGRPGLRTWRCCREKGAATDERAHLSALAERGGIPAVDESARHLLVDFKEFRLKWERQTELSSYSFYAPADPGRAPLSCLALVAVPADWVARLPSALLVGINAEVEAAEAPERSHEEIARLLGTDAFAGSLVTGGGPQPG